MAVSVDYDVGIIDIFRNLSFVMDDKDLVSKNFALSCFAPTKDHL